MSFGEPLSTSARGEWNRVSKGGIGPWVSFMQDPQQTPSPGENSAGVDGMDSAAPVAFPPDAEPSDDTPTIISKSPPLPAAQNGSFAGGLKGRTLAHFELLGAIGVGGMAAVLRARDKQLDRIVALKILPPDMAADSENIRRFHQEARSAAKLDHENIARVYFCGEDQRLHFIAFEFVEGQNLKAILERRGRIPVPEAVRYMLQIATGLDHAATRGVVHRDIKPSNIIITPTGRAKLVDMGLARSLERPEDQALTQSGVTLGTFDYISPEQALEPREADSRSDIYSLGCTFYHMLTGQPPVPEGTAAKKLHHHQHVAPIDPRQLNPEIPDEVAGILMRMMAKDAKDRYQRPAHLVQHLLQVAQKVGAAADVPEGVMFVDAPLPQPPHQRPLLMASLAALCLGGLLFLLSLAPSGPPPLPPDKFNGERFAKDDKTKANPEKEGPAIAAKPTLVPVGGKFYVSSEEKLAQALEDQRTNLQIVIEKSFNLSKSLVWNGAGGRSLTIESKNKEEGGATLSAAYAPADLEDPLQMFAGLLIDGGTVTLSHLIFEIEAEATPDSVVAAVGIRKADRVEFVKCTFRQERIRPKSFLTQPLSKKIPVASVAIESITKKPVVEFKDCVFEKGQVAIAVGGPAEVKVTESIFFPHSAFVHVRGDHQSSIALLRCDGFVTHGPVFRIDDDAQCKVRVEYSILSRLENVTAGDEDPANLIHHTTSTEPKLTFSGKRNCYHNLNAYWVWQTDEGGAKIINDLNEFHAKVVEAGGKGDPNSSALAAATSPWFLPDPLFHSDNPKSAAKLRTNLAEVRISGNKSLGPQWVKDSDKLPWLGSKTGDALVLKPNEMVVDPDADKDATGTYQTVAQAIAHAQPGTSHVIYLKHSKAGLRNVDIGPEHLDKPGIELTFKPYPGYHPILSFGDSAAKNAAMFKLQDGNLQFENLDIQLESEKEGFKSLSVVQIIGNGHCGFRNCIITLKEADSESDRAPLSVVTLLNPDDAMKMPGPRQKPEVLIHDCYVRGEGDLVRAVTSRPVDLDVANSQIVLSGSLLAMTGNTMETPTKPGVSVRLANVAAFLKEPLFNVTAVTGGKSLVFMDVENAKSNLFVALGTKPLLSFDLSDQRIDDFFSWRGDHNAYWGYEKLLDMPRSSEAFMVDEWRNKQESDLKQVAGRFTFARDFNRPLSQASLDLFKVDPTELQGYGAMLSPDMLPRLEPERKIEPGSPPEEAQP